MNATNLFSDEPYSEKPAEATADVGTAGAAMPVSTSTPTEPSKQKLLSVGVLWPAEVDRVVADERRVKFLVEGFLQVKSIAMAAGESTIGKSPLFYQMGLCVAAGIPFLGMPTEQGRVLYLDLENSLADSRQIRDAVVKFLGRDKAPDDFLVKNEAPVVMLDGLLDVVKPVLVIVDSLRAFRPDATAANKDAGTFLNEMRRLSRKHGCSFVFVHHLRKPGRDDVSPDLDECPVSEWMLEMEGPRAFVNQSDLRIAIAEGDADRTALKVKWNRRVFGDSPLVLLERVFDDDGETPLGYRQLSGAEFLNDERRKAFEKLGDSFTFTEAMAALGKTNNPTTQFLKQCRTLGLIEKDGREYRKVGRNG
ncbi:MAG TPA: AAA family ATPase [Candidatus Acidoferrales bacterium]|nr:AAA family ATPase [Candidatus Acidoferrales bacterium]